MSTSGPAVAAEDYFAPRETPWFRARLAARVAVPLDRGARTAAAKLAWSTLLAAPPVTIALVAPASALNLGNVLGLCCAALPGVTATVWSATRLAETRRLAGLALRQAGAEQRTAWLVAAGRLALFAGAGALLGAACLAALHGPLAAVLPKHSPLRALFAASASTWMTAVAMTAAFAVCGALLASSPFWTRVDWSRYDLVRRGRPACERIRLAVQTRLSSRRAGRPPR